MNDAPASATQCWSTSMQTKSGALAIVHRDVRCSRSLTGAALPCLRFATTTKSIKLRTQASISNLWLPGYDSAQSDRLSDHYHLRALCTFQSRARPAGRVRYQSAESSINARREQRAGPRPRLRQPRPAPRRRRHSSLPPHPPACSCPCCSPSRPHQAGRSGRQRCREGFSRWRPAAQHERQRPAEWRDDSRLEAAAAAWRRRPSGRSPGRRLRAVVSA